MILSAPNSSIVHANLNNSHDLKLEGGYSTRSHPNDMKSHRLCAKRPGRQRVTVDDNPIRSRLVIDPTSSCIVVDINLHICHNLNIDGNIASDP